MRPRLLFPLLCLTFLLPVAPEAVAQTMVPKTWALRPSDNPDGQGFRLLFVTTTTRDATETGISVYDSFVQSAAANGHAAIRPYSAAFRVLGSAHDTAVQGKRAVWAREHTETDPKDGAGVPIYWLNGDKIVDNYADFWNFIQAGTYKHNDKWLSYVRTDEDGDAYNAHGFQRVFTGTEARGSIHGVVGFGAGVSVKTGRLNSDPSTWSNLGPIEFAPVPKASELPFYGLSPVFEADVSNRAWINATSLTLDEGGEATYTLSLNTDPGVDVTVTAESGQDSAVKLHTGGGSPGSSVTLTFTHGSGGNWASPQTVTVTAAEDTDADSERNVSITHTVSADSGPYRTVRINRVRVDVTDNDTLPEVTFSSDAASMDEAAGAHNVTVNLSEAPTADITVAYMLSGAATRGDDYGITGVTSNSGSLDIATGATTATIPVAITDDSLVEDSETVVLTLTDGTGYEVGSSNVHTLTITDNDEPEVTFASALASADEAAGTRNVTVSLDQAPAADVTVAYMLSGTATRGDDYGIAGVTSSSGSLDIADGAATATIPVAITDDGVVEGSETVVLTLTQGTGYAVGSQNAHTLTITDNDVPGVTANPDVLNVDEGGDDGTYTLVLDAAPSGTVIVTPSVGPSDAVVVSGALMFDGSNWQDPQTVTVAPQDDADADNESVTITHAVTGYGSLTQGPDVIVGVDDDEEPATEGVDVSTLTLSLAEGGADGSYTVVLRTDPGGAVTVTPVSGDAEAVSVSDALMFDGSNWQDPQTVTVTPEDDADTDDENVTITHEVTGYTGVSTGPSVQARVQDDDEPSPVASFASSSANVGEGSGASSATVNFNPAPASDVTLRFAVTGTATEGSDFSMGNARTVAVLANAAAATIPITIADDDIEENDETIVLTLESGAGYEVGTPSAHTLVIADDDATTIALPEASLSASPNPVTEGETVTITASLSQSLVAAATIPLVVAAGTAEAADYSAPASIVIAANAPGGTGMIATVKDDDADDETFTVSFGALPGVVLAGSPSSVEITITDTGGVTSIEEEIPSAFALEQNYPNPFNPSTTIAFSLDEAQRITLTVYDMLGQEVRVLADGVRPAAHYRVTFDASGLASGTYVYVLRTDAHTAVKTMHLLK